MFLLKLPMHYKIQSNEWSRALAIILGNAICSVHDLHHVHKEVSHNFLL